MVLIAINWFFKTNLLNTISDSYIPKSPSQGRIIKSKFNVFTKSHTEEHLSIPNTEKIDATVLRAKEFAMSEYNSVFNYMKSLGVNKPIHIGESGWSTVSDDFFGAAGSKAADEYKEAIYYKSMRDWTNKVGISLFYFEAFDEPWKDSNSENGSENHFGLFTVDGQAKYALWEMVDKGVFEGLTRGGNPIIKTYSGDKELLMKDVLVPSTAD